MARVVFFDSMGRGGVTNGRDIPVKILGAGDIVDSYGDWLDNNTMEVTIEYPDYQIVSVLDRLSQSKFLLHTMKGMDGSTVLFNATNLNAKFTTSSDPRMFDRRDHITGNSYGDNLNSGNADDQVFGKDGNDTLSGGEGADRLEGGNGNDLLKGQEGRDTLMGGQGADTLVASRDQDLLLGGLDEARDVFIFNSDNAFHVGFGGMTIRQFGDQDVIDLRGIDANARVRGNQSFDFSGKSAEAFSIWFRVEDGGVRVHGDTYGLSGDFEFFVAGVTRLNAADFLL
jgi:Ca2+-binding RTX toxin-like protein